MTKRSAESLFLRENCETERDREDGTLPSKLLKLRREITTRVSCSCSFLLPRRSSLISFVDAVTVFKLTLCGMDSVCIFLSSDVESNGVVRMLCVSIEFFALPKLQNWQSSCCRLAYTLQHALIP